MKFCQERYSKLNLTAYSSDFQDTYLCLVELDKKKIESWVTVKELKGLIPNRCIITVDSSTEEVKKNCLKQFNRFLISEYHDYGDAIQEKIDNLLKDDEKLSEIMRIEKISL
jgi:hypothetical protein